MAGSEFMSLLWVHRLWLLRLAGTPPLAQAWLVQSVVYVGIMIVEKLLVSALIQLDIWDTISRIILAPVTNPRLELALVVLVVPFFVNVSVHRASWQRRGTFKYRCGNRSV